MTVLDDLKYLLFQYIPYAAVVVTLVVIIYIAVKYCRYRHKLGDLKIKQHRRASGVIFGKTKKMFGRLVFLPTKKQGHVMAIGGSGSGKTATLLINTLRTWNGTSFVVDISGDISRNVPDDNKVTITPDGNSDEKYDVLAAVDAAQDVNTKNERLMQFAFSLIPDKPSGDANADYYQLQSRKLLQATLIAYYHAGLDFIEICKQIMSSSMSFLLADINASNIEHAKMLIGSLGDISEKTAAGIKDETDNAVSLFAINASVSAVIGRGGISPATLKSKSVYMEIPDAKLELYAPLLRLFVSQTMNFLSDRENGATPHILLALDEFASLGKLEILPALRKFRKKNIKVLILIQSLVDLDITYGNLERKSILDNCDYKVILRVTEPESQRYFSDLAGECIEVRSTETVSMSSGGNAVNSSFSETEQRVRRIEPEEFGLLDRYLVLFYPRGFKVLRKNPYYSRWY